MRKGRFLCSVSDAHGDLEEDHADDEEDGDHADAGVDVAGDLADGADEGGAHEGGAFAADIQEPEVFTGLGRWDDAREVGAREGLDAALEHADHDGQQPELPLVFEKDGEDGDAKVGDDADGDEFRCGVTCGEAAEEDGEWKGHDLRHEERQQEACRVQSEGGAVGSGHVDDGVDAVDIEEESEEKEEDLLFRPDVAEGAPQSRETLAHGVLWPLHVVLLFVAFEQRQREEEPPDGRDAEGELHGQRHRDADGTAAQDQRQRENEGRAAADIAPGVASGGNHVHAFVGGDVREHGVVEDEARLVADLGDHKDHQEDQPVAGSAQRHAAHQPDHQKEQKDRPFEPAGIGQRAKGRPHEGHSQRHDRGSVTPVGQVIHAREAGTFSQAVEIDRHDRCDQERESRVADVVKDPVAFEFCQFE